MLDAARKALRVSRGRSRADLENEDDPLADGLVRLVAVIGEAANEVSPRVRAEIEDVPWPDVVKMRHKMIHHYYDINLDILWATVQDDLPPLIEQLTRALEASPA